MRSRSLDEIHRSIVTHLAEDGRRSYTLIGKSVGLSEASVRQRVATDLDVGWYLDTSHAARLRANTNNIAKR